MQQVTYEGKQGWLDESTNKFFPKDSMEKVTYEGKKGLLHTESNQFFPVEVSKDTDPEAKIIPKDNLKTPEWAGRHPNLYGAYGAAKETLAPVVKGLALAGGGALGGVPGAALSYGIADSAIKRIEEQVGERTPATLGESAIQAGEALQEGAELEMGGRLPFAAAKALKETKLPERLFASAVKAPLARKWLTKMGPERASMREESISAGLTSHVRPTEFSKESLGYLKEDMGKAIDKSVSDAAASGAKAINKNEIVSRGMAEAYAQVPNTGNPIKSRAYLDALKKGLLSGRPDAIPVDQANAWKQGLYKEVNWPSSTAKTATMQLKESAFKGVAHELMVDIEHRVPEVANLNKNYGPYKNLEEVITRAVSREGNKDLVPLSAKVLLNPKYWVLGVWDATLGNPQVKTQIAFTLEKARKAAGGSTTPKVNTIKEIEDTIRQIKAREVPKKGEGGPMMPEGYLPSPESVFVPSPEAIPTKPKWIGRRALPEDYQP